MPIWLSILLSLIAYVLLSAPTIAAQTDEALLLVLLNNKLITPTQFEALKATGATTSTDVPPAAEAANAGKPLPKMEDGLLEVLLANELISRQQYVALQVKSAQDKTKKQDVQEAVVTLKDGLKMKFVTGDFSAQLGAYAQLDSAFYNDDLTDFSDGTELHRTRLSLSGTVYRDWDYKVEADFAGTTQATGTTNEVTVTDAFLRYTGLKPVSFTAGNFKVPFSLEAVGSAKYTTFMERGLPFAFLNLRSLGGMVAANGDNWTGAVGLFGDTVTTQNVDDEGKGAAGRVTYAPFFATGRVLHLGVGGQYRVPGDNASGNQRKTARFRSKPESNIISDNLAQSGSLSSAGRSFGRSSGRSVDTGDIPGDVDDFTLFGAEAAGVLGPASLQGEYIRADINRNFGGDLAFTGYYLYGSVFLTNDTRAYKGDRGVFDAVQPNMPFRLRGRGWGAWEIAARFSSIDLSDDTVVGGEEQDITVGLNWYPHAAMRFMANYVHVIEIDGGAHDGEDLSAFQVRAQVAY